MELKRLFEDIIKGEGFLKALQTQKFLAPNSMQTLETFGILSI